MIEKLYKKYFQKSKSFLYPSLGIKKGNFTPINTYLSIEGLMNVEDVRLICCFKKLESVSFKKFEDTMLLGNPLFLSKINYEDFNIYVFTLEIYESDFFNVILGKYSSLSQMLKKAIKEYFGEKSLEYSYIETYLYPEKFYDKYSELLDVKVSTLKKIGELCDPADLEKETLKISKEKIINLEETV